MANMLQGSSSNFIEQTELPSTATAPSITPSSISMPRHKNCKTLLPSSFVPSIHSVVCGRGKACSNAVGNRRLKVIVGSYLKPYSEAKNKLEKSAIVSSIVSAVQQASPEGAFVKFEKGLWWEVEDSVAREKVGCLLRDCLHTQYRSSTKAKLARRRARKAMGDIGFSPHVMVHGNPFGMGSLAPNNMFGGDCNDNLNMYDPSNQVSMQGTTQPNLSVETLLQQQRQMPPMQIQQEQQQQQQQLPPLQQQQQQQQLPPLQQQQQQIPQRPAQPAAAKAQKDFIQEYMKLQSNYVSGSSSQRLNYFRDVMPTASNLSFLGGNSNSTNENNSGNTGKSIFSSGIASHSNTVQRALAEACDIVKTALPAAAGLDEGDLPDDMSELFDD